MSARLVVLIAEPHAPTRLLATDALREGWQVNPLPEGEDAVRLTRKIRPAMLLLSVAPGNPGAALRAARSLKTEANPPRLGLLDRGGRLPDPDDALNTYLADGVLIGRFDADTMRRFAAALMAAERPIIRGPVERGLLDRILRR